MTTEVTTYYLEMKNPLDLRPKHAALSELEVKQAKIPSPELNRFLYTAVGGEWYWIDRLPWTHARWLEWLDRVELQTWVAYLSGTPAGYFELELQPGKDVEIAYFGILSPFVGRGLGGHLLTVATEKAWQMSASRVWVHTCSLDHPRALATYLARGFQIYKKEMEFKELPERPPGPWPEAERTLDFSKWVDTLLHDTRKRKP